jgi:hypothetical protein
MYNYSMKFSSKKIQANISVVPFHRNLKRRDQITVIIGNISVSIKLNIK